MRACGSPAGPPVESTALLLALLAMLGLPTAAAAQPVPAGCTPIDRAGYEIRSPGHYCVTQDLHTRLDFADHSAENPVIRIMVGNVTVDLLGHTLGRGRLFTQPGGSGIGITTMTFDESDGSTPRIGNVVIRNGVLADFRVGVDFFASTYRRTTSARTVAQTSAKTFVYAAAQITIDNVTFKRCKQNLEFMDWVAP